MSIPEKMRPAPYSGTDEQETLAIDTFRSIVDHKQVKLDVKERDKYPNIDGYIEIVDEENHPVAKLEVQVKKLPEGYENAPKLQCPTSLFAYAAKVANYPVLLVGVDVSQKKAYWTTIPWALPDRQKLDTQDKISVIFPISRAIDGRDTRYVIEWQRISENYQAKLREHDRLAEALVTLSKNAKPALGMAKPYFRNIHEFLDEMNALLDGPFSIVKRRFYPNSWKVGFAFSHYTSDSIGYTLYPIRSDENDVQIKQIGEDLVKEFTRLHGFTQHSPNPIALNPKQHASELVRRYTARIIEGRLLDHKGSMALAREFLFAFVDRFAVEMGLQEKDFYSVSDIQNGFYRHLPIWVEEAVKLLVHKKRNLIRSPVDCFYRKPYLDPDMLRCQIMAQEIEEVEQQVLKRIASGDPSPRIPIGSEELPLGLFVEYDSFLNLNGVMEIHRLYDPPDYSRMPHGGYIWEAYSRNSVEKNLKAIYGNFPEAYSSIVEQSFPQLRDQLTPFDDASDVIVVFDAKDRYASREEKDIPGITLYYLRRKAEIALNISVRHVSECKELVDKLENSLGKTVEVDGKECKLVGISSSVLRIITEDLPMHTLVYQELKSALRKYFKTKGLDENRSPFSL